MNTLRRVSGETWRAILLALITAFAILFGCMRAESQPLSSQQVGVSDKSVSEFRQVPWQQWKNDHYCAAVSAIGKKLPLKERKAILLSASRYLAAKLEKHEVLLGCMDGLTAPWIHWEGAQIYLELRELMKEGRITFRKLGVSDTRLRKLAASWHVEHWRQGRINSWWLRQCLKGLNLSAKAAGLTVVELRFYAKGLNPAPKKEAPAPSNNRIGERNALAVFYTGYLYEGLGHLTLLFYRRYCGRGLGCLRLHSAP